MVGVGKVGRGKSAAHHLVRIRSEVGGIRGILRQSRMMVVIGRGRGWMRRSGRRMKRKNGGGILIVLLRAVRKVSNGRRRSWVPSGIRRLIGSDGSESGHRGPSGVTGRRRHIRSRD